MQSNTTFNIYIATGVFTRLVESPLSGSIKRDQLDVICFIISLFTAQHVSDVNTFETFLFLP